MLLEANSGKMMSGDISGEEFSLSNQLQTIY